MEEKYSLGLDIGTNSIGWAVVDEKNEIVKKDNFALWGVRMFDSSKDASEKRGFRNLRRRYQRRKQRLILLRSIFEDEINKVDATFFRRLEDSFYHEEDKEFKNHYNLFNDSYTDKDFYKAFPTIYHLRNHLLESNKKEDIRFIYLACHHMIKYRGNFLYPGNRFEKNDKDKIIDKLKILNIVLAKYKEQYEDDEDYFEEIEINNDQFVDELGNILNGKYYKDEKKTRLLKLFQVSKKSLVGELIIPLLSGGKVNLSKLYFIKENGYEKMEISVLDEKYDDILMEAVKTIKELSALMEQLPIIKEITDYFYLLRTLGDNTYLCQAMVNIYNEHKEDLSRLKKFIKNYLNSSYDECFKEVKDKLYNYPSYIGMATSKRGNRLLRFKHCKKEEFYSYLKSLINKVTDENAEKEKTYFIEKIEQGKFLQRQNSNQNGSFPMQLNLQELEDILYKQAQFYQFLNAKDDKDIDNIAKIISIFKYKLPYYVGPLNKKSQYSWVVRTDERIYPWNFDSGIIDFDETAKEFILRMQNKCTYLKGDNDYGLPKKSILYSEYMCLQYLNKLNINGSLIDNQLKTDLYKNVFLKVNKPTKNKIIKYLEKKGYKDIREIPEVTCDMSSYIKFKELYGNNFDQKIEEIEQIILDITIFEDKSILENRLKKIYKLDDDLVKKIKGLNYKGYGNLSRHFLEDFYTIDEETGERFGPIINILRNTNYNLQQILYNQQYKFKESIDKYNENIISEMNYGDDYKAFIKDNIYTSPIMKRALIQSYRIIKEVKYILGAEIDKYYIECTRHDGKKEIKKSRYNALKDLYASCKSVAIEYGIDMTSLKTELDQNQDKLRSDKVYLYFTQLGRSMYSFKKINFSSLFDNNQYDIDHIYPQSMIKDDSISNRVLVTKDENKAKLDKFTFEVPDLINPKAYGFYQKLLDLKLISKEKFKRLTKKEISNEELDGFVNRQIVATNQAVIGIVNLLRMYEKVDNSRIVFSKAEIISDFRKEYKLVKSRTANNYHHAHDAYLNVVVGRAINKYYTYNYFNSVYDYHRMKNERKTINPSTILKYNRTHNGEKYWEVDKVLYTINKNLYNRFDIRETKRMTNPNTMFHKTQLIPASDNKNPIPIKLNNEKLTDTGKYGGYPSPTYCKLIIISKVNKGKVEYILEPIPRHYKENMNQYINYVLGYKDWKIIKDDIMINVVCEYQKRKFAITGVTGQRYCVINLKDRFFEKEDILIIKKLEKYNDNCIKKIEMKELNDCIIISPQGGKNSGEVSISVSEIDKLANSIVTLYSKDIYNYSVVDIILTNFNANYNNLDLKQKITLLIELLNLFKTNERLSANLTLIGGKEKSGILYFNKKLLPSMKLIYESPTGYFREILFEVPDSGI